MFKLYRVLLLTLSGVAVIYGVGSSILFIQGFNTHIAFWVYGIIALALAVPVLSATMVGDMPAEFFWSSALLLCITLSLPMMLAMSATGWGVFRIWVTINSSIVALVAFVLAERAYSFANRIARRS